jgi:hypothetical protein
MLDELLPEPIALPPEIALVTASVKLARLGLKPGVLAFAILFAETEIPFEAERIPANNDDRPLEILLKTSKLPG